MITAKTLLNRLCPELDSLDLNLDFEIKYVTSLEGGTNCLSFCKFDNYKDYLHRFSNSVILISISDSNRLQIIDSNITIPVSDPRFTFAKIALEFNIKTLYINPSSNFKVTKYDDILKKSNLVSKTAKIFNTMVGENCSFHHNVLVGVDDYCPIRSESQETIMFPQLGYVKLGNNVDVFNNSIIGRGALCITEVGDNTKIDALCQVGHNCKIGKNCMITAGVIIAGSTIIGDNVFIGVGSHIRNGLHIGNNVTIAQGSNVVADIPDNAVVMGNPAKITKFNSDNFISTQVP